MNRTSVNLRDSGKLLSDVQDHTNMTEDDDKHNSNWKFNSSRRNTIKNPRGMKMEWKSSVTQW